MNHARLYRFVLLILILITTAGARAQQQISDQEFTLKIKSLLQSVGQIKPGLTRKDVLVLFTTEGGLSSRSWNHFVLRTCPYIKIDVTFSLPADADEFHEESTDIIKTVSKPYLEYGIYD